MKTQDIIVGLTILDKYSKDNYSVGGEPEAITFSPTLYLVQDHDIKKLIELGWIQDIETDHKFGMKDYDPSAMWVAST